MRNSRHYVDVARFRADRHPDRIAFRYSETLEGESIVSLTYGALDRRSRAIAQRLIELGLSGERVLLLYPPGLEFIEAILGCFYAAVIAVPVHVPPNARGFERLAAIAGDAGTRTALTPTSLLDRLQRRFGSDPLFGTIRWVTSDDVDDSGADPWRAPEIAREAVAFLQYTSGSTAAPRGVIVTHANLVHNMQMIEQGLGHSESTIFVSWLPHFHDMGLIGNVLQSVYVGSTCSLMSPVAFVQRPIRWLRAITRYQATTSGAPNFAYEMCVRTVKDEDKASLDLRSWDLAFNGAEPIRADTLDRFAAAFAPCGFRRNAFYPCYGLAEATLFVTGGRKLQEPAVLVAHEESLAAGRPKPGEGARTRALVGCGATFGEARVRIVDPDTRQPCEPGAVGEIWIAGPSVARGYWGQRERTVETFEAFASDGDGPFLRSGDLGFVHDGALHITGRIKDVIIVRGRNHYPQDVEYTVETSHAALRPEGGAAFAVEIEGEQRLVVAHEIRRDRLSRLDPAEVNQAACLAVTSAHGLTLHRLLLVRPGALPRTTSGKVQRRRARDWYLSDGWGDKLVHPPSLPARAGDAA